MPDVHLGRGATVGTVIPTRAAIVPAAVGVDIGCGMLAVKTDLVGGRPAGEPERKLRSQIERDVPVGFDFHKDVLAPRGTARRSRCENRMTNLEERYPKLRILERDGQASARRACGASSDRSEGATTSSRSAWMRRARCGSCCTRVRATSATRSATYRDVACAKNVAERIDRRLPHRDLAWLDEGTPEFEAYVEGLGWAQEYASLNRDLMLYLVHRALEKALGRKVGVRR